MCVTTELHDLAGKSTYMALASFDADSRKAEHAEYMRSIFIDIDVSPDTTTPAAPTKGYPSKLDAIDALVEFLQATGLRKLGKPWLVDSGGGVHAYWPLNSDTPIAAWKPVAEAFKRCAKDRDFRIDMTVTADAARVLRMPGTHNYKYDPPRPVHVLRQGDIFALDDIMCKLQAYARPTDTRPASLVLPGVARHMTKPSVTALALMGNNVTYFKNIMVRTAAGTGCGQVSHYIGNAHSDGMEPLWRGMLSLAKVCEDGEKASLKLSALHPYDRERMQLKLSEIKGPYSCLKLDSENPGICSDCPHWGKITNPLALGRESTAVTVESTVEVEVDEQVTSIHRPSPPRGYSFGRVAGVFMQKSEADKDGEVTVREIMLLPFDFFMIDMLLDDGIYTSRFMALKGQKQLFVAIPNKAITSRDNTMAVLASQNIVASFGSGNDKNLFEYVRACIGEASTVDEALIVPPNYGWQDDSSFAVGDTVYKGDGSSYTFVSNRLSNLISVTQPKGTLEDWAQVMQMLMRKGLWGHMAMLGVGFGSALMHLAPAGARAMTFHIASSASGVGKSLALGVCNSVWGSSVNYSVKPATSERTMLQRAGMLGGLPLAIDEVTNKVRAGDKEWLPNHIFDFSQGGHKLKGSGSANAEIKDDLRWDSLGVLTSNAPIMEAMMGARDTTSNGEAYRLLEWDGGSERLVWTPAEREQLKLLGGNYGVAGRVWAQWLARNRATAQSVFNQVLEQWRDHVHAPDEERFWSAGCAAIMAALILIGPDYANILTVPLTPVKDFNKKLVLRARRIINTNRQFASDLLNNYVRENHGGFVKVATPKQELAVFSDGREVRPDSTKGAVRGRIEYNVLPGWTDFYIEVRMLKEYCARRNKSYMEFLREIQTTSSVSEMRKDLLAKTKGPELRVLCLKISQRNEDAATTLSS